MPVRNREVIGVVVKVDVPPPPPPAGPEGGVEAKPILATPDVEPALTPELLETATWMAGYYGAPLGLALKAVLPGGMWGKSRVMLRAVDSALVPGGSGADLLRWLEDNDRNFAISSRLVVVIRRIQLRHYVPELCSFLALAYARNDAMFFGTNAYFTLRTRHEIKIPSGLTRCTSF